MLGLKCFHIVDNYAIGSTIGMVIVLQCARPRVSLPPNLGSVVRSQQPNVYYFLC